MKRERVGAYVHAGPFAESENCLCVVMECQSRDC